MTTDADLYETLETHGRRAAAAAAEIELAAQRLDAIPALRHLRAANEQLQEAAMAGVELALREGHSQKATAEAAGIPPSALRGARRAFGI